MHEQLNAQLVEARERLDHLGQLRVSLAPARERLTTEAHRVQHIENRLAEAESQIQSLESFTLQSMLDSLLWKKEGKLCRLRDELARLGPEYETGERALLDLEAAVKAIEAEIAELGNAEEGYKSLCDQKCTQVLADGGGPAQQLEEVAAQLNAAKGERQALRKCLQVGKNLIGRIQSKTKALGRAKGKMMHHGPLGALGAVAVNAVHRKTAGPVIRRAQEGLQEFARCIAGLTVAAESERDGELVRIGAVLGQSTAELSDESSAAFGLIDLIHQAIGLAQSKLDEVEPSLAALEARRIEIIEAA